MLASLLPHALLAENSLFKLVGDIFHPIFIAVATVLAAIYGVIPNYALAIILLTILIMAVLTPLTIKSTKSMIAMQRLQPELTRLRQKYKGPENREMLNQEMMRIYKEQGVNPAGSCLPMFLQMPFLIVLYDVIRGLSTTVARGKVLPAGTIGAGHKCVQAVCAIPRYIPTSSKMFHNLVGSAGAMKAFGLNLALKPFSHHGHWYAYVPYFALVLIAVVLQYVQMSQMSKRNSGAAQLNPQMQTMQKVMPVVFAYIYFLIPAAVVIYMIVSTGIRIGTQDVLFRTGIVQSPGERSLPGSRGGAKAGSPAIAARSRERSPKPADGNGKANGKAPDGPAAERSPGNGTGGGGKVVPANGARAPANGTGRPSGARSGPNQARRPAPGSAKSGNTQGATGSKAHPRARDKRTRKAR
ncbi:MAG TPA: membrane protein insertase YidC [Acidimicrobiales bacterium]